MDKFAFGVLEYCKGKFRMQHRPEQSSSAQVEACSRLDGHGQLLTHQLGVVVRRQLQEVEAGRRSGQGLLRGCIQDASPHVDAKDRNQRLKTQQRRPAASRRPIMYQRGPCCGTAKPQAKSTMKPRAQALYKASARHAGPCTGPCTQCIGSAVFIPYDR